MEEDNRMKMQEFIDRVLEDGLLSRNEIHGAIIDLLRKKTEHPDAYKFYPKCRPAR